MTAKRIKNSLERTLDFNNYKAILPPSDKECFTVTLSKAKKYNPPKTQKQFHGQMNNQQKLENKMLLMLSNLKET